MKDFYSTRRSHADCGGAFFSVGISSGAKLKSSIAQSIKETCLMYNPFILFNLATLEKKLRKSSSFVGRLASFFILGTLFAWLTLSYNFSSGDSSKPRSSETKKNRSHCQSSTRAGLVSGAIPFASFCDFFPPILRLVAGCYFTIACTYFVTLYTQAHK